MRRRAGGATVRDPDLNVRAPGPTPRRRPRAATWPTPEGAAPLWGGERKTRLDLRPVTPQAGAEAGAQERRREQRICDPFPARVSGTDADGRPFEVDTVIDNISTRHLYLRLLPYVMRGAALRITFRLSADPAKAETTTRVEVRGSVIRSEEKPGRVCGVAVAFESHRFIYGRREAAAPVH